MLKQHNYLENSSVKCSLITESHFGVRGHHKDKVAMIRHYTTS